jgi:pimeloyl-ACP methyl ester carboxylesterase
MQSGSISRLPNRSDASLRSHSQISQITCIHLVLQGNFVCLPLFEIAEFDPYSAAPRPFVALPFYYSIARDGTHMSSEFRSLRFQTPDEILLHSLHWRPEPATETNALPPVILLHGGGANAHWWDHLGARLASRRDVYALDFRGHGDSAFPEKRFVGAFNTDLEAMLSWLGREDVYLIGHSLGAGVALDHASRFANTRGIVLVDLARGGTPGGGRRARLALSLRRTYRTREEAIERFRFVPESASPDESIRVYIAEHSVQLEPDGRFGYKFDPGWFSLPSRPRPDLSRVLCPTLLVRGSNSTLLSSEAATSFIQELAAGRLLEIPDAGHHVLIDQPDRLFVAIQDFVEGSNETT